MQLSKQEITEVLQSYFPTIKKSVFENFLSISTYSVAKNKSLILKSGRTDKCLIFILKGVARAYTINDKGQELNDHIRAQGHLMGDARVFGNEVQILNIEAIGEIHYLKFDTQKLEAIGLTHPDTMKFYLGLLKEIILAFNYRLNSFITMTAEERYIDLIRWNPILIESAFDKHLASFLGMTPLTLHRIKKKRYLVK